MKLNQNLVLNPKQMSNKSRLFAQQLPEDLDQLFISFEDSDWHSLEKKVQYLLIAEYYGYEKLSESAEKLERALLDKQTEDVSYLLSQVSEIIERITKKGTQ